MLGACSRLKRAVERTELVACRATRFPCSVPIAIHVADSAMVLSRRTVHRHVAYTVRAMVKDRWRGTLEDEGRGVPVMRCSKLQDSVV